MSADTHRVTASRILLLAALVLLFLRAFGVGFGPCDLGWTGLACLAAAFLA